MFHLLIKKSKGVIKKYLGGWIWVDVYLFRESLSIRCGCRDKKDAGPSLFFFTTHKCASTFTPKVFDYAAKKKRLVRLDYAKYIWHKKNTDVYKYLGINAEHLFRPRGYIYAPLREWVPSTALESSKVIIMLRDPRDVLVSMYYSIGFTHELPGNRNRSEEFMGERRLVSESDLDTFVLGRAGILAEKYSEYFREIKNNVNFHFCTYEEMILSFDGWLNGIENFLAIRVDPATREKWRLMVTPPLDESMVHKRKMLPGDYKNKLERETIDELNRVFAAYLGYFERASLS